MEYIFYRNVLTLILENNVISTRRGMFSRPFKIWTHVKLLNWGNLSTKYYPLTDVQLAILYLKMLSITTISRISAFGLKFILTTKYPFMMLVALVWCFHEGSL